MTPTVVFYIIIAIYTLYFIYVIVLNWLNLSYANQPVPPEISDIFDANKRQKQLAYQRTNLKFLILKSTFSYLFIILLLCCGGFAWLDGLVHQWTDNAILQALVFYGIIMLAETILELPFEIYDTFVIEQRFGFNRTTLKTFVLDELKSLAVNMLISGLIVAFVVWIYTLVPQWFWLMAWAVVASFSLFMSLFYSSIIVPLFNQQTPLPDGELRTAIESFASKVDFKIDNIFVMDSSKRSSKANAYFTGWGPCKRIVLYDTLIDTLTTDEIVAVLAHEIGHNKNNHTVKGIVAAMVQYLVIFVFLGIVLKYDVVAQAVGCESASFHINAMVFFMLYKPVSELIGICTNIFSRRHEYEADAFVKQNGMAQQLIMALKKLTSDNLGNPTPHPIMVMLEYSHPTLYQRIKALE